jgi:hypothetical protein
MASCGSAAQRGLWPPVALQPSAVYGLLWLCSTAQAMASCGSAAQRRLWPLVALQPSAGYGLLWLCSPSQAMAFSSSRFLHHTHQPCHLHVPIVLKSGSLNLLELSGPVKACNGIALPAVLQLHTTLYYDCSLTQPMCTDVIMYVTK